MGKRAVLAALFAAALAVPAADLPAQAHFGGQLSIADDADFGIGGRIAVEIPEPNLEFAGSFDIFFPDDRGGADVNYFEINGNLLYYFDIRTAPSVNPYLGGGLNIARIEVDSGFPGDDNDDTRAGLNLMGGVRFDTNSSVKPFVEFRGEVEGGEQFVVTGGILFF